MIPGFQGQLITSEHADYEAARAVWNGAVDRRPRYIARCLSESDVAATLRFTRDHGLAISVRGGGVGGARRPGAVGARGRPGSPARLP